MGPQDFNFGQEIRPDQSIGDLEFNQNFPHLVMLQVHNLWTQTKPLRHPAPGDPALGLRSNDTLAHTHTHTLTHSLTHSLSHSLSHSHSLTHTRKSTHRGKNAHRQAHALLHARSHTQTLCLSFPLIRLPAALLACAPLALVLADSRCPALLASAPDALVRTDARTPALLAHPPLALVRADARPTALLACVPLALVFRGVQGGCGWPRSSSHIASS